MQATLTSARHTNPADLRAAQTVLSSAVHDMTQGRIDHSRLDSTPVFITVSRQPGAGGLTFSHKLAERLTEPGKQAWVAWDQELVEKVSADHDIAKSLIESLADRQYSWLDELIHSFTGTDTDDDLKAYKRVAMTIRALAGAGHAIIVGRGGVFLTSGMPGGIHIRIVAPLRNRIEETAKRHNLAPHDAAWHVVEIDRKRSSFYKRFWPHKNMGPENFTLTLNGGELSVDEMIECVLPIIRAKVSKIKA